jgi:hypothetical protein
MASALGAIRWYVLSFVFITNVNWGLGDFTEFRWSTYTSSMDCRGKAHYLYKITKCLQQFLMPYLCLTVTAHYIANIILITLFPNIYAHHIRRAVLNLGYTKPHKGVHETQCQTHAEMAYKTSWKLLCAWTKRISFKIKNCLYFVFIMRDNLVCGYNEITTERFNLRTKGYVSWKRFKNTALGLEILFHSHVKLYVKSQFCVFQSLGRKI